MPSHYKQKMKLFKNKTSKNIERFDNNFKKTVSEKPFYSSLQCNSN